MLFPIAMYLCATQVVKPQAIVGVYYEGDGIGMNHLLTLNADGRFTFSAQTDTGGREERMGTWKLEGELLVLKPTKGNDRYPWKEDQSKFVPIVWNKAVDLVAENEMPGFLAALRENDPFPGHEVGNITDDIHSLHYRKLDASKKKDIRRAGVPSFPARFKDFYLRGAVVARVSGIEPDGTVRLMSKMLARLRPGMMLALGEWNSVDVLVTAVSAKEATGQAMYYEHSKRALRPGDKVSTGDLWISPQSRDTPRALTFPGI